MGRSVLGLGWNLCLCVLSRGVLGQGPKVEPRSHDCEVSGWTSWSECDRSFGGGQQIRAREISKNPSLGGKQCPNKLHETRGCNPEPCDCTVSEWGNWGVCSVTCGMGERTRTRNTCFCDVDPSCCVSRTYVEAQMCESEDCKCEDCKCDDWKEKALAVETTEHWAPGKGGLITMVVKYKHGCCRKPTRGYTTACCSPGKDGVRAIVNGEVNGFLAITGYGNKHKFTYRLPAHGGKFIFNYVDFVGGKEIVHELETRNYVAPWMETKTPMSDLKKNMKNQKKHTSLATSQVVGG